MGGVQFAACRRPRGADQARISEQYCDAGIFQVIPQAALRATLGILVREIE